MTRLDDAITRTQILSTKIKQRTDVELRNLVKKYEKKLHFEPLENLMISEKAWEHVSQLEDIQVQEVFAHPDLLIDHPKASGYYRGIALLPQKRVGELVTSVASWEDSDQISRRDIEEKEEQAKAVAQIYNAVISSIIEGATDWAMENGYRNIIATMAIGLDGTMRNIIGKDAEDIVKKRIRNWLTDQKLIISCNEQKTIFNLVGCYTMYYKSEPDIEFQKKGDLKATIEIKGGRDKAAALERLGAMTKSFENTPKGCANILIAGVITQEMENRLKDIGTVEVFLLDDVITDGPKWFGFLNEVFHHILRIVDEIKI